MISCMLVLALLPTVFERLDPGRPPEATAALLRTSQLLLERQEGPSNAEWPYEGVYRERGSIPAGYRVGGTGICGEVLLELPA
ncbi:MAG: hypothetical protein FJ253_06840, partial [Phycisphaerae bacterium]|nr:hypothetical protein [Phycisphaerae bacterium]